MAVERKQAPVLDLSRPGGLEVEIDVAEAAEVLMSICAVGAPDDWDTLDVGADWLRERSAAVPQDLLGAVDELLLGTHKLAAHLLGIVLETPQPRTFDAFLERLAGSDGRELTLHLLGHYGGAAAHLSAPDTIERALAGDGAAREEFLGSLGDGAKCDLAGRLLDTDGTEVRERLLDLLPRWRDAVFAPTHEEWLELAERDAAAKRALAERNPPERLTELATQGYQYVPARGIRRLTFFPSWWMRPWVVLWEHKGTKIFCHPIAAAEHEGASPAEVARVYKALGDEGRLRLLRRLAGGPLKLSEAAAELGVGKSTAHHHLAILRQSGFVTIRDEDESVYSLRADLPQAGELLAGYLGSSSSSARIP